MTIEEKGKAAILGHGAWCQVLGLICDFHMLAEDKDYSSANYQISILKPTDFLSKLMQKYFKDGQNYSFLLHLSEELLNCFHWDFWNGLLLRHALTMFSFLSPQKLEAATTHNIFCPI